MKLTELPYGPYPLLESRDMSPFGSVRAQWREDGLRGLQHDDDSSQSSAGSEQSQHKREQVVHGMVPHRPHELAALGRGRGRGRLHRSHSSSNN